MGERFEKAADELMLGAYDLRVRLLPSVSPREQDGFELICDADAAGMSGILLKSHYRPTAQRAASFLAI